MYLRMNIVLHSCGKVLRSTVVCLTDCAIPGFKISGLGFYMIFIISIRHGVDWAQEQMGTIWLAGCRKEGLKN